MKTPKLTHHVQYLQADGSWRDGYLGLTLSEAKEMAKIGASRTGRKTRVAKLPR